MADITITLPDGSTREYASPTTAGDIAASIGRGLAKAAVAAKVDGEEVDLTRPIDHDADGRDRHRRHAPTGARCCGTPPRT